MTKEYEEYLAHYGVKGQKWGQRNYQNADGTLTEEGKRRYFRLRPESKTWKKKDASKLSDDELNRRNARMQRESTYIQNLEAKKKNRHPKVKAAKDEVVSAAKKIFVASAVSTLSAVMAVHYKEKLLNSDFIKEKFPEYVEAFSKKKYAIYKMN